MTKNLSSSRILNEYFEKIITDFSGFEGIKSEFKYEFDLNIFKNNKDPSFLEKFERMKNSDFFIINKEIKNFDDYLEFIPKIK